MSEVEVGGAASWIRSAERDGPAASRAFTPLALGSPAFRRLFQTSSHGMVIVDDNRRYLAVNDAAGRLFGLAPEQVVGRRIDDFTAPDLLPVLPVMWAEFLEEGTLAGPYEIRIGRRRTKLEFAATANIAPGRHMAILLELEPEPTLEPSATPAPAVLSRRERDVLALLANGMRAEEAAAELGVARNTVQNHLRSARAKLGARTRSHAIALAIGRGEIPVELDD